MTNILYHQVFKLYGLAQEIVSGWRDFCTKLGSTLNLLYRYHPQTNGQMESLNCEIGQMPRAYCSNEQHQWAEYLSRVKFPHNSFYHSTTDCSPFQCVLGYQLSFLPEEEIPNDQWARYCKRIWQRTKERILKPVNVQKMSSRLSLNYLINQDREFGSPPETFI